MYIYQAHMALVCVIVKKMAKDKSQLLTDAIPCIALQEAMQCSS